MTIVVDDPLISRMAIAQTLPLHESSRRLRELYPECPRVYGVAVMGAGNLGLAAAQFGAPGAFDDAQLRFESDRFEILTGVRHGRTLGSPIAVTTVSQNSANPAELSSIGSSGASLATGRMISSPFTGPKPSAATRGIHRIPYSAAKGGINAITASLALEYADHGIRVVATAPGGTEAPPRYVDSSIVRNNEQSIVGSAVVRGTQPVIDSFTATPGVITAGQTDTIVLSWTTIGAETVNIEGVPGQVGALSSIVHGNVGNIASLTADPSVSGQDNLFGPVASNIVLPPDSLDCDPMLQALADNFPASREVLPIHGGIA